MPEVSRLFPSSIILVSFSVGEAVHKKKARHFHHHGHGIHSPTTPGPHERKARMLFRYYQSMNHRKPESQTSANDRWSSLKNHHASVRGGSISEEFKAQTAHQIAPKMMSQNSGTAFFS